MDIDVLMEVMPKTSADSWQLRRTLIDKVLKNDFSPMFKLKPAHKDIKLIKEMTTSLGVKAPGVDATLKWYDDGRHVDWAKWTGALSYLPSFRNLIRTSSASFYHKPDFHPDISSRSLVYC